MQKEAKARIKINKLLEQAGWRLIDTPEGSANVKLEGGIKFEDLGENFENTRRGFVDYLLLMKRKILISSVVGLISILFLPCGIVRCAEDEEFEQKREMMAKEQIEARGVKDKGVLEAMRKVKRHLFVPLVYRHWAYADTPLPIGEGQTISQPYIVGLMTELLVLKGNEKVLEIGTGSGYQAAILAELTREVYTIEILKPLAKRAIALLKELGYENIRVKYGDGFLGWPEYAPFDAIMVTCASKEIPPPLIEQLAEGGRLVIPVGREWQELKLVQKINGKVVTTDIIPVRFVPMLGNKKQIETEDSERDKEMVKNLKMHVLNLSHKIGERNFMRYQNLEYAADYIKQELKNYGLELEEQVYNLAGKAYRNVIATKKGSVLSENIFIVCAHYDSVFGSPGADDNASGVAGLIELARLVSKEKLNQTVKFIAFTNEEPPFFMTKDMGSLRYAQEAKRRGEDILGVFCLESIGYYSEENKSQSYPLGFSLFYPSKGNFIAVVSNFSSRHLLRKTVKGLKKEPNLPVESLVGFGFLVPAIGFSDHWSFWQFGYKAMMLTDTAFYRNRFYHTPEDTFEKLNYQRMSSVIKGLATVIKDTDNSQE